LGTPAVTTLGMKEQEMKKIAGWIAQVAHHVSTYVLPAEREARAPFIKSYKKSIDTDQMIKGLREEVREFAKNYSFV
ncbi:MAG TPA: hypothetical protein VJ246_01890, partial [Patescibacteria group bacterium]|nr:hypothetical protein [Patescibacteria group bacterium]